VESSATFKRALLVLFSLLLFTLSSLDTAEARRRNRHHDKRDNNRQERCDEFLTQSDRQAYFDNRNDNRGNKDQRRQNQEEKYKSGRGEEANFDAIRERLHNELASSHRTVLGYSEARQVVMLQLDFRSDSQGTYVWDYYCQRAFRINNNQMPNSNSLNIEHTWPQHRFSPRFHQQKSDLHHLFPTDSWANQLRGHMNFGMVEKDDRYTDANCKESRSGYDKNGQMRFQPPASHRGAIARAWFYFAVRYKLSIDAEHEAILREWDKADPVTAEDIERNRKIAAIQGNSNPFIDDTTLIDQIDNFR
jgi:deoxyribonuclease I